MSSKITVYEVSEQSLVNPQWGSGEYLFTNASEIITGNSLCLKKSFGDTYYTKRWQDFVVEHPELGNEYNKNYVFHLDNNAGDTYPKYEKEVMSNYYSTNGKVKYLIIQEPAIEYPGDGVDTTFDMRPNYRAMKREQMRLEQQKQDEFHKFPFDVASTPIKVEVQKDEYKVKQEIKKDVTGLGEAIKTSIEVQLQIGGNMVVDGFALLYLLGKNEGKSVTFRSTNWSESEYVEIVDVNGMTLYMKTDSTGQKSNWTGTISELRTNNWEISIK